MARSTDDRGRAEGSVTGRVFIGALAVLVVGAAGFGLGQWYADVAPAWEAATRSDVRVIESLDRFTVNLRGTGGGRVLRMEIQVEVLASAAPIVQRRLPELRDGVLSLTSDYTYAEIEGLDGKMRLRDELMARLNAELDGPTIERMYFTEFVVQ